MLNIIKTWNAGTFVSRHVYVIQLTTILRVKDLNAQRVGNAKSEWSAAERAELRRRYKRAHEHPPTIEYLRNAPDLLDPDFG